MLIKENIAMTFSKCGLEIRKAIKLAADHTINMRTQHSTDNSKTTFL